MSAGLFVPLVCTDVLYLKLFYKIRGVSRRRHFYSHIPNSRNKLAENQHLGKSPRKDTKSESPQRSDDAHAPNHYFFHCQSHSGKCKSSDAYPNNQQQYNRRENQSQHNSQGHASNKDHLQHTSWSSNGKVINAQKVSCSRGSKYKCTEHEYGTKTAALTEAGHKHTLESSPNMNTEPKEKIGSVSSEDNIGDRNF